MLTELASLSRGAKSGVVLGSVDEAGSSGRVMSILSFNVFVGSPFSSFLRDGTPPLVGSRRIKDQFAAIMKLRPDVVALQEIYFEGIEKAYIKGLGAEYDYRVYRRTPRLGAICFVLIHIFGAAFLWAAMKAGVFILLRAFSDDASKFPRAEPWIMSEWDYLYFFAMGIFALFGRTITILVFLRGRVNTANMIMFRRDRIEEFHHPALKDREKNPNASKIVGAHIFHEQSGDFLNWFRPRGFIILPLQLREYPGNPVYVVDCHCSLGSQQLRQVQQIVGVTDRICRSTDEDFEGWEGNVVILGDTNAVGESEPMKYMINQAADGGRTIDAWLEMPDKGDDQPTGGATWTNENHLAVGWHRLPDHRSDYIFYRSNAMAGGMQNLGCSIVMQSHEGRRLSDHYGVIAKFRIEEARSSAAKGAV